ncbi:hypothetical protein ETB97_007078 [Aspergillus alliaceus]|uniref:Uncharacterized protein n=1 Tax=Petromyces alliaceus TaxID=209559 RepID=A0A8H5ZTN1_PETAA|nr:hypothetical protein ETB97_007078 [Aspergillus burnettii]
MQGPEAFFMLHSQASFLELHRTTQIATMVRTEGLVNKSHGTTWIGTLINAVTDNEAHIGSYTLPNGTKGIRGSYTGFVEWYPWNSQPQHDCSTLHAAVVVFSNPFTTTAGAGQGSIYNVYIFSQFFNFGNLSYGGAIEFRPSSANGKLNYLQATFHSFVDGATTKDKNCKPANWGQSTRCAVLFRGDFSHTYHMTVRNSAGTTWIGTIIDTTS